jgi:hypothetical protein
LPTRVFLAFRFLLLHISSADRSLITDIITPSQGCQTVCFQTKNPNLGKFWRVLLWKILVYFLPFGLFYGHWK